MSRGLLETVPGLPTRIKTWLLKAATSLQHQKPRLHPDATGLRARQRRLASTYQQPISQRGLSDLNDELLSGRRNALNRNDDLHKGARWRRYKLAGLGRLALYLSAAAHYPDPQKPGQLQPAQLQQAVADQKGPCG